MPYFVVGKTEHILGTFGKSLRGSSVLVAGVAYKRDLPDYRESPALKIIALLASEGAHVDYHDPYIPELTIRNDASHDSSSDSRVRARPDDISIA